MRADCERGGLVINRKLGESVSVFIDGVEVRVILDQVHGQEARIRFIGDRTRAHIFRTEKIERGKEEG